MTTKNLFIQLVDIFFRMIKIEKYDIIKMIDKTGYNNKKKFFFVPNLHKFAVTLHKFHECFAVFFRLNCFVAIASLCSLF